MRRVAIRALKIPICLFCLCLFLGSQAKAMTVAQLEECVARRFQSLKHYHGIVAAIVSPTETRFQAFGEAKLDQMFEIGSVTKTLTATLLAQAVIEKRLKLEDPIPAEYQKPPYLITYQQLATHTSGIIEGNFPGFRESDPRIPYSGMTVQEFKELYAKTPLAAAPGEKWMYSNIGYSLLGLILSEKWGSPFETILTEKVLSPLQLKETFFAVPDSEQGRLADGHLALGFLRIPFPGFRLYKTPISPAGGLHSTISDLAKFANSNLVPGMSPLQQAIELTHQPVARTGYPHRDIGLGWNIDRVHGLLYHDGSTLSYNSIVAISRKLNLAVVAMTDTGVFRINPHWSLEMDSAFRKAPEECFLSATSE